MRGQDQPQQFHCHSERSEESKLQLFIESHSGAEQRPCLQAGIFNEVQVLRVTKMSPLRCDMTNNTNSANYIASYPAQNCPKTGHHCLII